MRAARSFFSVFLGLAWVSLGSVARANTIDVQVQNFQFTGEHLVIQLGDTVRWTNFDPFTHTTTEGTDLILNGNEAWHHQFGMGGTYSVTFNAAFLAANPRPNDTYSYFCVVHTPMRGSIMVVHGPGLPFCFCSPLGPCSNRDYGAGCVKSGPNQLRGARMLAGGSTRVAADDLVLLVDLLPVNQACILFRGKEESMQTQLGEGWRCIGSPFYRKTVESTGAGGVYTAGPGIVASTSTSTAPILAGQTWSFQLWYRDSVSQCGNISNVSNGYTVTFKP